jgi:hypothetical protein
MQKLILSVFFCCLLGAQTFGATHKIPSEQPIATVAIPEKWQSKPVGEGVEASSPDGEFHLLVVPGEAKINETMGEVMRYVRNSSGITVNAQSMKNEAEKLNGMDVRHVSWQGKDKNGDVKISFRIISLAEKERLLLAYWASPKAETTHRAELKKVLESIKKT